LEGRSLVANHATGDLIKISAKIIRHGRYITFQLAEVAVSRALLAQILGLIADLRAPPPKPA